MLVGRSAGCACRRHRRSRRAGRSARQSSPRTTTMCPSRSAGGRCRRRAPAPRTRAAARVPAAPRVASPSRDPRTPDPQDHAQIGGELRGSQRMARTCGGASRSCKIMPTTARIAGRSVVWRPPKPAPPRRAGARRPRCALRCGCGLLRDVAALQAALRARGSTAATWTAWPGRHRRGGAAAPAPARAASRRRRGAATRRALGRRGRPRLGSRPLTAGARGGTSPPAVPARAHGFPNGGVDGGLGARPGRPAALPGVGRTARRRRGRARDLARAAPHPARLAAALRASGARRGRRRLRPSRHDVPHRARLRGAARPPGGGGRGRLRRGRPPRRRRLRQARRPAPRLGDDELVRAPVDDRGAPRPVRGGGRAARPRRLDRALDRPAPALRAAPARGRGRPRPVTGSARRPRAGAAAGGLAVGAQPDRPAGRSASSPDRFSATTTSPRANTSRASSTARVS